MTYWKVQSIKYTREKINTENPQSNEYLLAIDKASLNVCILSSQVLIAAGLEWWKWWMSICWALGDPWRSDNITRGLGETLLKITRRNIEKLEPIKQSFMRFNTDLTPWNCIQKINPLAILISIQRLQKEVERGNTSILRIRFEEH